MTEEEWGEPLRLEKAFSSEDETIFFNGGDAFKFGSWMYEKIREPCYTPSPRVVYQISHLASCRVKISGSTRFFHPRPLSAAGSERGEMIVGGQEGEGPKVIRKVVCYLPVDCPFVVIDFRKSRRCPCSGCRRIAALSTHSNAFANWFASSDCTDVVFEVGEVGEVEIPAHKAILAARCDYFKAQFGPGWKESETNRVPIVDVDPKIFREMIRFVYSGESPADLASEAAAYLPVADRFGIEDLKSACSEALKKSVTTVNLAEIFDLADTYHCPELAKTCGEAMEKMLTDDTVENVIQHLLLAQKHQFPDLKEECFRRMKEFRGQRLLKPEMLRPLQSDPQLMAEFCLLD